MDPIRARILQSLGNEAKLTGHLLDRHGIWESLILKKGCVTKIAGREEAAAIPGIIAIGLNVSPGDCIGTIESADMRPGHLLAVGDSSEEVAKTVDKAKRVLEIEIDSTLIDLCSRDSTAEERS